ncbi:MAG TPA: SpoIIE family protein phosphatase [Kofleriaceae bacterium]|nr:SpoIIE family protein phosphatase [Kofleriaceae bacterium]
MKLRTGILIGIVALVAAIVVATALAVAFVVDEAERRKLAEELDRSEAVFRELLSYRAAKFRSDCRVVAREPRAITVLGTQDISRETIVGVMDELRTSLGSDLFLLTDPDGLLIGDVKDPEAHGFDLAKEKPAVAAAKKTGEGAEIWLAESRPHQVSACRVDAGGQTLGIIVIGNVLDSSMAEAFYRQTGSTLLVTLDGAPVATSPLAGGKPAVAGKLAPADGEQKLVLAGDQYLARGGPLPGYDGKKQLRYAVMRSLDEALAPGRRLMRTVFVIAAAALLAAFGIALLLSSRLSRPVGELVRFTHAIGKGELERRATPAGATEVVELAKAMNTMVEELDRSRRSLAEKQRLERELEIAARIQTSILPKRYDVAGLEIAARMIPASEVGGDYYDVFATGDGCWIGIGDVAGHGLSAGLEMLMVQSVVSALVRHAPKATPSDHVRVLNAVLYDNIRDRLGQDEHITLTLMRYEDGVATFAGAHEEILIARAAGGTCEHIETPGTWLGGMRDVSKVTRDSKLELGIGDVMVLYTDGITEAKNQQGKMFGDERFAKVIEDNRDEPVGVVLDRVIEAVQAWQAVQDDDISLVVIRRRAI